MHQDYPNSDTRYPWVSWASPTNYTFRKGLKVKMCNGGRERRGDAMVDDSGKLGRPCAGVVWTGLLEPKRLEPK